jgi:hypothetical protein
MVSTSISILLPELSCTRFKPGGLRPRESKARKHGICRIALHPGAVFVLREGRNLRAEWRERNVEMVIEMEMEMEMSEIRG